MKTLVKMESPVTQTVEAVQQLIAYFNHGQTPEEMPSFYRLSGELVLVQAKKGDAYYVTTPKSCSCPSATYNPGKPCKHSRKYFPQPKKTREELEAECKHSMKYFPQQRREAPKEQGDLRVTLPGWPGGMNGPVEAI